MSGIKINNLGKVDYEQSQAEFARSFATFQQRINGQRFGKIENTLLDNAFDVLSQFEQVSSRLYLSRLKLAPHDPKRRRIEENMAEASHAMVGLCVAPEAVTQESFTSKYRRVWRDNFPLFVSTALVFIASVLIGWYITLQDPEAAHAFVGRETVENILSKQRWFDSVQSNPLLVGIQIAQNNIKVTIFAFVGGAVLGIGGLYILLFNGLMVGSIMAFCYRFDFHEELGTFIISHGFLELSIIVVGAFAGFLFGRVFYMRPYRLFQFPAFPSGNGSRISSFGFGTLAYPGRRFRSFCKPFSLFQRSPKSRLGSIGRRRLLALDLLANSFVLYKRALRRSSA